MPKKTTPFKNARTVTGLTQAEAAKRTRIAQSVISDLESGSHRTPSWETLGRLSVFYGCNPFDLMPLAYRPKPAPHRMLLGVRA